MTVSQFLITISVSARTLNTEVGIIFKYTSYRNILGGCPFNGPLSVIKYPYVKVYDATLRPLLNIKDPASHNPVASATVRNLRSPIVI